MNGCRVAGFAILGLTLLAAGLLGAPPVMLAIAGGFIAATAFLPGGSGASALSNLAQKLYDRDAWETHWSEHYLPEGREGPLARARSGRRPAIDLPPSLLPEDPRESKALLRTLEAIRALPEPQAQGRGGRLRRAFGAGRRPTRPST